MVKKSELKPLQDRVIIEQMKAEEKTKGGVILPDSVEKERPQEGKVIAIGVGKYVNGKLIRPEVKKGDLVLYKKYSGDEVKVNGKELIILDSADILAVIK